MNTQFMVRVQRRFRRWGLRMRSENLETIGFMERGFSDGKPNASIRS
jgi:hypothetical protein